MQNDKEIIENRQEKTLEEIGIDSLGTEAVYMTKKSPLFDDLGQIIGIVGNGVDITIIRKI